MPTAIIPEVAHSLRADGFDASEDGTGRGTPLVCMASAQANAEIVSDGSPSLTCSHDGPPLIAFTCKDHGQDAGEVSPTLRSMSDNGVPNGGGQVAVASGYSVRRLTPLECERLMGFPDGWTDVPYRGKQAADGPRYKAIGNSMAVNVMAFIGARIAAVGE